MQESSEIGKIFKSILAVFRLQVNPIQIRFHLNCPHSSASLQNAIWQFLDWAMLLTLILFKQRHQPAECVVGDVVSLRQTATLAALHAL